MSPVTISPRDYFILGLLHDGNCSEVELTDTLARPLAQTRRQLRSLRRLRLVSSRETPDGVVLWSLTTEGRGRLQGWTRREVEPGLLTADERIRRYRITPLELEVAETVAARRGGWTLCELDAQVGPERAPAVYQVVLAIRRERDGDDPGLKPPVTLDRKRARYNARKPR